MSIHSTVGEVTERIVKRSHDNRARYLDRIAKAAERRPERTHLGCANQAHGFAACGPIDKERLREGRTPNLGIVTAYNDMLSAHQPYERFPPLIREAAREAGATAQVAGGTPAMCDGITQGFEGMEVGLFSREVIALSTAVALSHQTFDATVMLGICDKIVPGLFIGAASFGHLPTVFIPSGPMTSGLPNPEKSRIRQLYAEGKVGRDELLAAEAASYHAPGTCTFYGTANTNQMVMEMMGVHIPGASFVNANTPLRDALTREGVRRALAMTALGNEYTPFGAMVDERSFVNAIAGVLATGGSTNHTLHLLAMSAAMGITLTWDDFDALSPVVPLVAHVYPSGSADVNQFAAAGGVPFVIRELLAAGLLHGDIKTVWGTTLDAYAIEPGLDAVGHLVWREAAEKSGDEKILRGVDQPFSVEGGIRVLDGNLGRAVMKTSALAPERLAIEGPARIFHSQEALQDAFKAGALTGDFVAVVRFQGPKANGMPELHKLLPPLGVLQDRGQRVALLTDGRMSGASGKVPSAIHVTPEAVAGGPIARIREGDIIRIDALSGTLAALVDEKEWAAREPATADLSASHEGVGRELFAPFRAAVGEADTGATVFFRSAA
ncbi:phosphogluconate dehydratase [Rhodomicrobium vannielii ATCC 17100]|uniref:phosphogluconate dehydratase n=1 Tax=Rhodomicrobium vannielii TaxID=1069 RepID=UPI001917D366|nr:phosphogluconate dehydratase [Rhodomicrobium vannielii ATCC 17100]